MGPRSLGSGARLVLDDSVLAAAAASSILPSIASTYNETFDTVFTTAVCRVVSDAPMWDDVITVSWADL